MRHLNLEGDLQPELNQPRIRGAGYLPETGVAQGRPWVIEVRGVGEIEELGPELTSKSLGHSELAKDRQVKIDIPRATENVAPEGSESIGIRRLKGARVKPF